MTARDDDASQTSGCWEWRKSTNCKAGYLAAPQSNAATQRRFTLHRIAKMATPMLRPMESVECTRGAAARGPPAQRLAVDSKIATRDWPSR